MRLVCEIGNRLMFIFEIDKPTPSMEEHSTLIGVPQYCWTEPSGALRLWPKPIPECKMYRLEEQPHAF